MDLHKDNVLDELLSLLYTRKDIYENAGYNKEQMYLVKIHDILCMPNILVKILTRFGAVWKRDYIDLAINFSTSIARYRISDEKQLYSLFIEITGYLAAFFAHFEIDDSVDKNDIDKITRIKELSKVLYEYS